MCDQNDKQLIITHGKDDVGYRIDSLHRRVDIATINIGRLPASFQCASNNTAAFFHNFVHFSNKDNNQRSRF